MFCTTAIRNPSISDIVFPSDEHTRLCICFLYADSTYIWIGFYKCPTQMSRTEFHQTAILVGPFNIKAPCSFLAIVFFPLYLDQTDLSIPAILPGTRNQSSPAS